MKALDLGMLPLILSVLHRGSSALFESLLRTAGITISPSLFPHMGVSQNRGTLLYPRRVPLFSETPNSLNPKLLTPETAW